MIVCFGYGTQSDPLELHPNRMELLIPFVKWLFLNMRLTEEQIIIPEEKITGYLLAKRDKIDKRKGGNTLQVVVIDESYISEIGPHSIVNYREIEAE